jgi:hypothetical protein
VNKKAILFVLAGYLLAFVIPPQRLTRSMKGKPA